MRRVFLRVLLIAHVYGEDVEHARVELQVERVVRRGDDRAVQRQIGARSAIGVILAPGFFSACAQLAQHVDIGVGASRRGETRSRRIEREPQLKVVNAAPTGKLALQSPGQLGVGDDERAAPLLAIQHPRMHEGLECLAHRVAPDAELGDEGGLGRDPLTDLPAAGHDLLAETCGSLVDQPRSTHEVMCARIVVIHPMIPSLIDLTVESNVTSAPPATVAVRRGHLVLWAGLAIAVTAVNLRTAVTGITPLLEIIGDDLGFGVTVAGLLGTVPAASFAVFGFLAPMVTRRFGLERTATVALGLTALSLLLRAFSETPLVLVLSTVLALAGIGAANVVIIPLVKVWFADRLALWTSLYLILLQTGQFVAPLLAVPVAEATTWRFSVGIWALPAAVAAAIWLILAIKLPADHHAPPAAGATAGRVRIARSSTAWGLVGLFAMTSIANYGIITWVPSILTDAGGSAALGGSMVALYSVWGVAAALVVPQLATRMTNPFPVVIICVIILVIGYLGMLFSPLGATVLWICALGIGVSAFPLCLTLINRRTRSAQSASAVSGFVQGIGYGIACFAPIGLGLLREATGSWTVPLIVLAATAIPGLIAGWFACRPRFVEDAGNEPVERTAAPRMVA